MLPEDPGLSGAGSMYKLRRGGEYIQKPETRHFGRTMFGRREAEMVALGNY